MSARPRKEVTPDTYSARFALRLKELREKAKLTPEQVAEALGMNLSSIYHWESGTRAPNIADLPAVAKALKLKKTKDLLPNE